MNTRSTAALASGPAGVARPAGASGPAGARLAHRSATRPGKARLTRRGRCVVVLVALVLLVVGFSMGRVSSQAAGPGHGQRPPTVTVEAGETLWQVAARVAPHVDPRLVVTQIQQLNHLRSTELIAGQQLVVPGHS